MTGFGVDLQGKQSDPSGQIKQEYNKDSSIFLQSRQLIAYWAALLKVQVMGQGRGFCPCLMPTPS